MAIDKTSKEYEKKRLGLVMQKIEEQLDKCRNSAEDMKRNVLSIQKSMWDHIDPSPRDLTGFADVWQFQTDIVREGRKAMFAAGRVGKLERMLNNPYFGRLDFLEDDETREEQIYIGLSNLSDEKTGEYYIYDWRAPVSSMFYDYETGRAGYDCPAGRIEGDILLKRQYRIWRGSLEFMFDCSLAIEDDILQEILSRSADSKMKTIVTSIQREQNRVIRNDSNRLVFVQGPAGSGKTSIALHRAAFLLYRYREDISAENIAIFSPNSIFSDYISDVLPELGEENIQRTTFMEYAVKILDNLKIETPGSMMEFILACKDSRNYKARISGMKLKSSLAYMKALEDYALETEKSWVFRDISHKDICIESKEEIDDYFRNDLKFLPVSKRLEKIRNRLISKLDPLIRERIEELVQELAKSGEYLDKAEIRGRSTFMAREEFKAVKDEIEAMTSLTSLDSYVRFIEGLPLKKPAVGGYFPEDIGTIAEVTVEELQSRRIFNEDVAPLLYLTDLLSGTPPMDQIRHVIIDEVQDYSIIQLELLRRLFRYGSLTLLGDPCQSINPYAGNVEGDAVKGVFKDFNSIYIKLTKSYRSTKQITAFCRRILGSEGAEYIERNGPEPEVILSGGSEQLYEKLRKDINSFVTEGFNSIALITRTASDARFAHQRLSRSMKIRLVTVHDEEYAKGVCVIPSYLSKGLEFDTVLVLRLHKDDYLAEEESKLFYTVCTRALHRLNIYSLNLQDNIE